MKTKATSYRVWFFGLITVVFAFLLAWDMLGNSGPEDLKGHFEEVAFVRNEQNKGGVIRIYAFSVSDTTKADYRGCGELMPHNDYGSMTTVYFFKKGQPAPHELFLESPHFDTTQYHPVAVYRKGEDGVGRVSN